MMRFAWLASRPHDPVQPLVSNVYVALHRRAPLGRPSEVQVCPARSAASQSSTPSRRTTSPQAAVSRRLEQLARAGDVGTEGGRRGAV